MPWGKKIGKIKILIIHLKKVSIFLNIFALDEEIEIFGRLKLKKRHVVSMYSAMKMAEKLAYPSAGKAIEVINSGSMNEVPVTAHDVARAYEAYGAPIPLLQGKTVHKSEHPYVPERLPRTISTVIQLHADIMFIEQIGFLITVSKPLDLVIVTRLGKGTGVKSETSLRKALIGQYHVYWGKGFEISSVIMDG